MEPEIYQLKTKSERFILFKFLKLGAVFIGTFVGLYLLLIVLISATQGKGGRSHRDMRLPESWAGYIDSFVIYASIAAVIYYVFTKVKNKQVEKFTFDDANQQLIITYKSYFLHIPQTSVYSYAALTSTARPDNSFLHGDYIEFTIRHSNKRVAFIGSSFSDWQRLPNTLDRIHAKIGEVSANRHGMQ